MQYLIILVIRSPRLFFVLTKFVLISQEYVEPPVSIRLKTQVLYEPSTRATSRAALTSNLDMVQVDSVYAVTSVNEEGFVLTACKAVLQSEFEGFSLQKLSDDSDKFLYKQSTQKQKFDKNRIVASIVSIREGLTNYIYHIYGIMETRVPHQIQDLFEHK